MIQLDPDFHLCLELLLVLPHGDAIFKMAVEENNFDEQKESLLQVI
jgi:hypothetical protein